MRKKVSRVYKFLSCALQAIKNARIPYYSSKFSKKTYTQHQLLALLCLKEYFNHVYRDIVDIILEMDRLVKLLELKKVPHFTTLHKFFKRFPSWRFDRILAHTIKMFDVLDARVGIDASGYTGYVGVYYTKRLGKVITRSYFIKDSIVVDTDRQIILANKTRRSPSHDNRDFKSLIRKVKRNVDIILVTADKAYDDESNHRLVRGMNAVSIIPVRSKSSKVKGFWRRRLKREFDRKLYNERNKVETVFSVIKRKFSEVLRSRLINLKKKEIKLKNIVYNLYRRVKVDSSFLICDFRLIFDKIATFCLEDFYKAK